MSSSTLAPRFLLDENVRGELGRLLKERGYDARHVQKGSDDSALMSISRQEKRVIITNDDDFSSLSAGKAFGVVWLRIPQRDGRALIDAFIGLLSECTDWEGRLVTLSLGSWQVEQMGAADVSDSSPRADCQ